MIVSNIHYLLKKIFFLHKLYTSKTRQKKNIHLIWKIMSEEQCTEVSDYMHGAQKIVKCAFKRCTS